MTTHRHFGIQSSRLGPTHATPSAQGGPHSTTQYTGAQIIQLPSRPLMANFRPAPTGAGLNPRPFYSDDPPARHWLLQIALDLLSIVAWGVLTVATAGAIGASIFLCMFCVL